MEKGRFAWNGRDAPLRSGRRWKMAEMIAYCGLVCSKCPGYLATKDDDDEARRKIAAEWSKQFNSDIKPEHINCDGCAAEGRHIPYCDVCEIRRCGVERHVENCAHCADYPCDNLEGFLARVPAARAKLDGIRSGLA
jgi:hypothetical protein